MAASHHWLREATPEQNFSLVNLCIFVLAFGSICGYLLFGGYAASNSCTAPVPGFSGSGNIPPLYAGLQKYAHLDKLSYLEYGDRVVGQATTSSLGDNKDNTHNLGQIGNGDVLFDQIGPGILSFMRMQESIGSPWTLSVDSSNSTIQAQDVGVVNPNSLPALLFPYPLSLNPSESQGTSAVTMDSVFQQNLSFQSQNSNGNFYSIYYKLPYSSPLNQYTDPANKAAATNLLACSGSSILPSNANVTSGTTTVVPNQTTPFVTLNGPAQIRSLNFHVPFNEKVRFGNANIKIYWDNETIPSVNVPIKFLAGDGAGVYQPGNRQLVQGLMSNIDSDGSTYMNYNYYWPMPFASNAKIVLTSTDTSTLTNINWSVGVEQFPDPTSWWGKFHATYTSVPNPVAGKDMNFLDVSGSGKLVGTVINFSSVGGTLEGNPFIYVDRSKTPQIAGTGTEEWGLGGDYWHNGVQVSLPLGGLPSSTNNPPGSDIDGAALYRFLISDSIPFNNHMTINWEHGGHDETTNPYRAAVLWYGRPEQSATQSDAMQPGNSADRASHNYVASDQLSPLTSAYEYLVNSPLATDTVASTTQPVTFTLSLPANNVGAFLRRTFNYCVANQQATVYIDNQNAGTWYSPGSATVGTGSDGHTRCWRDEDFPLPQSLTSGKSSISVKLSFVKTNQPADTIWTAAAYSIFSYASLGSPTPPPAIAGDCDSDGHVTITDLSILLSHYNQPYGACDFNADSIVNIVDLSILLSNYGT